MKCALVIQALLSVLLIIISRGDELGATYCVKPTPSSGCDGHSCQQCETLSFYLTERSVTNINKQKNVTLYFLNGTHSGNCALIDHSVLPPLIKLAPQTQLVMIGENRNVIVRCLRLYFDEIAFVQLEKLVVINSSLHFLSGVHSKLLLSSITIQLSYIELCGVNYAHARVQIQNTLIDSSHMKIDGTIGEICLYLPISRQVSSDHIQIGIANSPNTTNTSILFNECEFRNGTTTCETGSTNVTLKDCNLINFQVFIFDSVFLFSGITEFSDSYHNSALLSFSSTIILSDNVSFINNTATVGGAMAFYSSVLKIAPGARISFINNSALERGGAIFIDPGFQVRELVLNKRTSSFECFYQVMDSNTDDKQCTLRFANNSAKNGGSDVYGASLSSDLCPDCQLEVDAKSSFFSSDPTRVCLCDDNGVPQCNNNSFIFMDLEIYPGEVFAVSAIVVGGDFGPTIGVVYALNSAPSFHGRACVSSIDQ